MKIGVLPSRFSWYRFRMIERLELRRVMAFQEHRAEIIAFHGL
jgi:hypothetical protein